MALLSGISIKYELDKRAITYFANRDVDGGAIDRRDLE
jgi:hypothetical protein